MSQLCILVWLRTNHQIVLDYIPKMPHAMCIQLIASAGLSMKLKYWLKYCGLSNLTSDSHAVSCCQITMNDTTLSNVGHPLCYLVAHIQI